MIPVGYLVKRVAQRPDWIKAPNLIDTYSVSGCISENFTDYINYWKHNGYWLFDSPESIRGIAQEISLNLEGLKLFYYEAHELEFDCEKWRRFQPEPSIPTNVVVPARKQLEGFDVVTFWSGNAPECSPLSCNGLAEELATNSHCLIATFEEAEMSLSNGAFKNSEPGPYRIFSVYSVNWD
jgi:hypothetical protein